MIAIVDYGAGNLRSVVNALVKLGYQPTITSKPYEVLAADAVILPGVGAAADTMASLKRLGLIEPIYRYISDNRPFLGICIGLQVLLTGSEEGGWHKGINIVSGRVKKLPAGLKTPHMGWNQVSQRKSHPIFRNIPDKANFYFVHSYYAEPDNKLLIAADTEYGVTFCSVLVSNNLIGTQFHPEKSGEIGLRIYDNFINLALNRG
ncbi:imidazole glycerol phosphate synthase subunit HisH [Chloroflexota bacterium]